MRRVTSIFILLILGMFAYAQNQFVYVRYNPKHGNVSPIVKTIDNLVARSSGKVVVLVSQASSPMIAANGSEWEELRSGLLRMQTAYEYYGEDEAIFLNQYFATLFSETVDNQLHLKGKNDSSWVCSFIISKEMLSSEEFESLAESISINELATRMSVDILTYDESQRLSSAEISSNTMFKFNISE